MDENVIEDNESDEEKGSVNATAKDHVSRPVIGDDLMQANIRSDDPFNIYDTLNKNSNKTNQTSDELWYPPGFTTTVSEGGDNS